jgi:hypothetical protein
VASVAAAHDRAIERAAQRGTTVDPRHEPAVRERRDVATHGDVGDAELLCELPDGDRAVKPEFVEDPFAAGDGEERRSRFVHACVPVLSS